MRSPYFFTFIAVAIYGLMNVIQEQRFAKYSPSVMLALYFSIMAPLFFAHWAYLRASGQKVATPGKDMILTIMVFAILYFLADLSYLTSYARGGNAFVITTVMIALPAFTAIAKFAWNRTLPTAPQLCGYALVGAGLYIILRK